MKALQECNWKEFHIEELFTVKRGDAGNVSSRQYNKEGIPLITASESNNGVYGFTEPQPTERIFSPTLSINNNGSVGCTFVHNYAFIATSDVSILAPKMDAGLYALKFVCPILQQNCKKYSYGYKISNQRLNRQTILLPVTPDGAPDWQFMEDYMRAVEKKLLSQTLPILQTRLKSSNSTQGGVKINKQNWKEFAITDIFSIKATQSGIDRNKLVVGDGDTPYITRSDANNGWDSFICEQPKYQRDNGNVLSVGLDTQTVFYQPCPFYTGQNIQVFTHSKLNRYVATFIIPLLKIQLQKFNWGGNGATLGRLKKTTILLPATFDGTPDWQFMEDYMREIENRQLQAYIAAKDMVIR